MVPGHGHIFLIRNSKYFDEIDNSGADGGCLNSVTEKIKKWKDSPGLPKSLESLCCLIEFSIFYNKIPAKTFGKHVIKPLHV